MDDQNQGVLNPNPTAPPAPSQPEDPMMQNPVPAPTTPEPVVSPAVPTGEAGKDDVMAALSRIESKLDAISVKVGS